VSPKVVVDGIVRAAGGVVVRGHGGDREVMLIHRPHREDWTFPKGHLEPGESDLEAACREVAEETGLVVTPVRELGASAYLDKNGRPKAVRYWEMRVEDGTAAGIPDDEVDEARWVTIADAALLLTYPDDRALLSDLDR
jgi:8-oxo-dGTP pyrophosphatase MutT (NUDIX family)